MKEMKTKHLDKKAWIRIVEAAIAVLIVVSYFSVIIFQFTETESPADLIYQRQNEILYGISEDPVLRNNILNNDPEGIDIFIGQRININWGFDFKICSIADICSSETAPYDKEVYISEKIIASDLEIYSPKKIKFFIWVK